MIKHTTSLLTSSKGVSPISSPVVSPICFQKMKTSSPRLRPCVHNNNDIVKKEVTRPLIGIDIGGTLTKCVYFEPCHCEVDKVDTNKMTKFIKLQKFYNAKMAENAESDEKYQIKINTMNGYMHFLKFQSTDVPEALSIVKGENLNPANYSVCATGGGAFKYDELFTGLLDAPCDKADELESLIRGIAFMQEHYPEECYTYVPTTDGTPQKVVIPMKESVYPFLLVNIGSGVSILKVTSENICERVGGCPMGGGTFFGLARLLTGNLSFEEVLKQAGEGKKENVDMLVKDIYGGDYDKFNLKGNVVASAFGKLGRDHNDTPYSQADVLASILHMITNNIGSIANLHASTFGIKRIIYSGNFFHHNRSAMYLLAMSVRYWSAGAVKALFLEHEGYCGAVGALLNNLKNIDFNVIPNTTIDDDDQNCVDIDPTLYVEEISDYIWNQTEDSINISIADSTLDNLSRDSITVESEKQSLFVQIHVMAESLRKLRIPLLFEEIIPEDTYYFVKDHSVNIVIKKKQNNYWPRLKLILEGENRTTRSKSCC